MVWETLILRMLLVTLFLLCILQSVSIEAARDGDVRLVDSNRYGEGRVEVFYEGDWGTICHEGWDLNDAEVICRQLGFPNGAQRSFYGARFGEGGGRVLLSDVNCVGHETNLTQCGNVQNTWAMNDCKHESDVGVKCSAPNYEGCFQLGFLRAIDGITDDQMTLENCFSFCAIIGYSFIWLHEGDACDCGNNINANGLVGNEMCIIECPGNSDQHCGGRNVASVYRVEVGLPYVASPGFPGQFVSTGDVITRNFNPQGTADYSFIRFHQFDLPLNANLTISSDGRTVIIQGSDGVGEYWVAAGFNSVEISFQLPQENIDSMGFLLEFGEGTNCPPISSVLNGRLSTTASLPYTVGTSINVICNPGYMAYDDTVFCQADGTFNRDIMCVAGVPTTAPTTREPQSPQQPRTTREQQSPQQPQSTQTSQQTTRQSQPANSTPLLSPGTTMAAKDCPVPAIENGQVNTTAAVLSPGDGLEVTCNFPYTAAESTVTCQRNGTFTQPAECILDTIVFIVIGTAAIVILLIIILLIILICCLCYFRLKRKRRVSSYERRNEQINIRGPYGGPPPLSPTEIENDEILALPGDDDGPPAYTESAFQPNPSPPSSPPPPPPESPPESLQAALYESGNDPTSNANESAGNTYVSSPGANTEQAAIQSHDNVVDDVEREGLYGRIQRRTPAPSSDFGGHFSRD